MLLQSRSRAVFDKVMRNAILVPEMDRIIFRCETHGILKDPTTLSLPLDCPECVCIGYIVRRAETLRVGAHEPPNIEHLADTMDRAVKEAEAGHFDLQTARHPNVRFCDDAEARLQRSIPAIDL